MIAAIVLAAGSSTRLGRPKQLLRLSDRTVIEHVVDRVLASRVGRVIVVVGHAAADVEAALGDRPIEIVRNPDYAQGQSTSLKGGIEAVGSSLVGDRFVVGEGGDKLRPYVIGSPDTDAIIVVLGDQPGIATGSIDRLIDLWQGEHPVIAMTVYGGKRSHPVLFSREVFPDLLAIEGDKGAREVIRRYGDRVVPVDSGEPNPPADIDTEEAYEALLASWQSP